MSYLRFLWRRQRTSILLLGCSLILSAIGIGQWADAVRPHPIASVTRVAPQPLIAAQAPSARSHLIQRLQTTTADLPEVLHRIADANDLSLDEVRYETRPEHDLPIVQRVASFTLTDSYAHVRHYVEQVLRAQNNLSLDAFDCTRQDIDVADVDCEIRIAAFEPLNMTGGPAQ
jgi:hypothetical protein